MPVAVFMNQGVGSVVGGRVDYIQGTAPSEHTKVAITSLEVSISITEQPTCSFFESKRYFSERNDSHMYSLL